MLTTKKIKNYRKIIISETGLTPSIPNVFFIKRKPPKKRNQKVSVSICCVYVFIYISSFSSFLHCQDAFPCEYAYGDIDTCLSLRFSKNLLNDFFRDNGRSLWSTPLIA